MKLWFENADGIRRVIKDPCNTWEDVNKAVDEFDKTIDSRVLHLSKAYDSMVFILSGNTMPCNSLQSENALSLIVDIVSGNTMFRNNSQPENALSPISVTDGGISE
jgi:hypothetical protein